MAEAHYDDLGNARVDFVWGNVPMQPNVERSDMYISSGGGYNQGDNGWGSTSQYTSDTLNTSYTRYLANGWIEKTVGTNHTLMYDGWSNFPGFIPNYAGDKDTGLETTVPAIIGLGRLDAQNKLNAAHLDWDFDWVVIGAGGITADLTQSSDALVWLNGDYWMAEGLKAGDKLWFDWYDGSGYSKVVTFKSKNDEDSTILVTFVDGPFNDIDTSETYNKSVPIDGVIYAYDEGTYGRVVSSDEPLAGAIVDEGTGVWFYALDNGY